MKYKVLKVDDNQKEIVILITDLTLHVRDFRPTKSVGEKIQEAMRTGLGTRAYFKPTPLSKPIISKNDRTARISIPWPPEDEEYKKLVSGKEGYKITLKLPEGGAPVFPGKDTLEFIESKRGHRVLKKLAKNKKDTTL